MAVPFIVICGSWVFALLRLIAAPRPVKTMVHPPHCEQCGYNLTGIAMQRACPECGLPLRLSLGEHVRPGCSWQRRTSNRRVDVLFRSMLQAAVQPGKFGRQLRLLTPTVDHHRVLQVGILLTVFIAIIEYVCYSAAVATSYERVIGGLISVSLVTLLFTFILALAITLASSTFIGSITSRLYGRNMLPLAIQGSSYLSGLLVIWTPIVWAIMYFLIDPFNQPGPVLKDAANLLRVDTETLVIGISINALALLIYLALLWRICAAARFANR